MRIYPDTGITFETLAAYDKDTFVDMVNGIIEANHLNEEGSYNPDLLAKFDPNEWIAYSDENQFWSIVASSLVAINNAGQKSGQFNNCSKIISEIGETLKLNPQSPSACADNIYDGYTNLCVNFCAAKAGEASERDNALRLEVA